jgi:hypothetical protein
LNNNGVEKELKIMGEGGNLQRSIDVKGAFVFRRYFKRGQYNRLYRTRPADASFEAFTAIKFQRSTPQKILT